MDPKRLVCIEENAPNAAHRIKEINCANCDKVN
jgi:hypothetical protein